MIDPAVHAALVTIAMFAVKWVFGLLNISLGDDLAGQLATLIVGYLLSLFGYSLYLKAFAKVKNGLIGTSGYHPFLM